MALTGATLPGAGGAAAQAGKGTLAEAQAGGRTAPLAAARGAAALAAAQGGAGGPASNAAGAAMTIAAVKETARLERDMHATVAAAAQSALQRCLLSVSLIAPRTSD